MAAEGHHRTYLNCRACQHEWSGVLPENALIGRTHLLVCSACGARDVAVSMSWVWGRPATADVVDLPARPGQR